MPKLPVLHAPLYSDGYESNSEYETIGIAPLVGLEYQIHEQVFVAIETGIGHYDNKSKYESNSQETEDNDSSRVNTFTNIMLRMMF